MQVPLGWASNLGLVLIVVGSNPDLVQVLLDWASNLGLVSIAVDLNLGLVKVPLDWDSRLLFPGLVSPP